MTRDIPASLTSVVAADENKPLELYEIYSIGDAEAEVIEAQVERAGSGIRSSLEKKGIAVKGIQRRGPTELVVELASPETWGRPVDFR